MSFFFFQKTKTISDRQQGLDALKLYHKFLLERYAVKYSFEEMIQKMDAKNKSFVEGFGLGIKLVRPSTSKLNSAMANVADLTRGQMPKNLNVFQTSLSTQIQKIELEDIKKITKESASDVEKIAKVAVAGFSFWKFLSIAVPLWIYLDSRKRKA